MAVAPRALFTGLLDDAALFPPGNAAMPVALAEHRRHRTAWYADMVGPFLCPTSRVAELQSCLGPEHELRVSLVVDEGGEVTHDALRAVGADGRLTLSAVEARAAGLGDDAAAVGRNVRRLGPAGFLEVPRTDFDHSLHLVGEDSWDAAKYRTGGTSADAFPDEEELAAFLVAAAKNGVPFKLTAGLHHAVRHTDGDTGFEQHGVLNVLLATFDALEGSDSDHVAATLADREAARLAARVNALTPTEVARVRAALRSIGCCGVTDPLEDLVDLRLVEETP